MGVHKGSGRLFERKEVKDMPVSAFISVAQLAEIYECSQGNVVKSILKITEMKRPRQSKVNFTYLFDNDPYIIFDSLLLELLMERGEVLKKDIALDVMAKFKQV